MRGNALVVDEGPAVAGVVAEQDLGQHDPVITGGHARHHPAHRPGEDVVQHGDALRALVPGGGGAEAVGAGAGEGGRRLPLVLAQHMDPDVVARGDDGPAGAPVPTPKESKGGSAETEAREVAVKPTGPDSPRAVITATPAACCRKTERSNSGEAGLAAPGPGPGAKPEAVTVERSFSGECEAGTRRG